MRFTPTLVVLSAFAAAVVASPTGHGGSGNDGSGGLSVKQCIDSVNTCALEAGIQLEPVLSCVPKAVGLPLDPIDAALCLTNTALVIAAKGVTIPAACTQCLCAALTVPVGVCLSPSK